jgi:hypothetical protein
MAQKTSNKWNVGKAMSDHYEWFDMVMTGMERRRSERELIRYLKSKEFVFTGKPFESYLGAYYLEYIGDEKDPLNLTLKSHLYIENFLEEILKKKFKNSLLLLSNRDFTFALKLDVLHAKNYLDEKLYKDIRLLNRLRNKFAHDLAFDIAAFDMTQFCYCEDLYQRVRVKSQEARRLVNISIFRNVLWELFLRLIKKHKFILEIKKT